MYQLVAIGGTFDRLHKGHQYFISQAFNLGRKVIIGLTSEKYIKENLKFKMQNAKLQIKIKNYEYRKRELERFLREKGFGRRAEIVKIDDVYGPAVQSRDIEALAVTKDTRIGADKINQKREKLGLPPFPIEVVKMMKADDERPISSTRIRLGEIDRWGKVFRQVKIDSPIPDNLRVKLKRPIGQLVPGRFNNLEFIIPELKKRLELLEPIMLITIGDEVTKIANRIGYMPDLAVIDYLVNRKKKYSDIKELYYDQAVKNVITVKNSPGFISPDLINSIFITIQKIVIDNKKRIIKVLGEEDLAGVPALLLAPLGSVILYGQPKKGVVVVKVTEEKKKELVELLTGLK